ncbi:DUF305 domain-containing protein [Pilimelia columellifera]|uniref:DUF305 domain-containing protein n=1 Tax=Pilimelia columellifera subsp. columellifera TaxID=706583 RepID=A0ABN3NMD0_9ACTN
MKRFGRAAAVCVGVAMALSGAACGDDENAAPGGAAATFNQADVDFATGMIPHHEQAIEMANLVDAQGQSAEVGALAEKIRDSQGSEITTMSGWLVAWGKPVPSPGVDGHADHPGKMSDAEMKKLSDASGKAFDTMFLTMMVEHHEGAIAMARDEIAKGANAEAKELAKQIEQAQTAEIAAMRALLEES